MFAYSWSFYSNRACLVDYKSCTVESRFYKPPRERKIGSKNRRVREIGGKITVFDWGGETTFGSNYREVRKTERSRNRDSTVFKVLVQYGERRKVPRGGNLTFSRCLGVGNLTLASIKMSSRVELLPVASWHVSRFAFKSIRLHQGRFAYTTISRFANTVWVDSPTLKSFRLH